MSMPPNAATVLSTVRAMSSARLTSHRIAVARPATCSMSRTVSMSFDSVRPATATTAPSRASARAMPRPIPCPAPVTIATLPSRKRMTQLLFSGSDLSTTGGLRPLDLSKIMCRDVGFHGETLDALVDSLVGRDLDAPDSIDLQILVPVQSAALRDDVFCEMDEGVRQIPDTF